MDEVLPGLWVGGVRAAMDADYLSRAGVTHIISCMKQQIPVPPPLADGRTITRAEMKHIRIDDDEKAPVLVHFAGCNELIASQLQEEWVVDDKEAESSQQPSEAGDEVEQLVQGRQKRNGRWGSWQTTGAGTVLVHCQAGCSRSVAITAAYLMHTRRISATTAVDMIRRRRADAGPNRGFMAQLELYEQVGFEIDMKWQSVRRFLMSKTDILNGDSMDDMLLSYYPSPYPSPGLSAGGMKGFTSIKPTSKTASSCSTSSSSSHSGPRISQLSSITATSSPSEPELVPSLSSMSTSNGGSSKASESGAAPAEVKVTANSSGRLPGGVQHVRGHEGIANRGQLSRPNFTGPKLRCKGCRRELAALDHVVIHEPGKGQMAFDHRKRDVGHQGQNVATNSGSTDSVAAQDGTGAEMAAEGPNVPAQQEQGSTETDAASTSSVSSSAVAAGPTPVANGKPKIQSAASLASQLPPHLAALRGARPRPPAPAPAAAPNPSLSSAGLPSSPSTNAPASSPSTPTKSMLKHPSCSSYFLEPMAWMSDLSSGEVTGRLNCPTAKCGQKLGSWDWAGMQCACGAWVTPAFSLHRSKVDEI
ncbi:Dual specificity phosphatase, catalytic domain protein [Kalmanozyma brasiliensis GHG001]|uniref:Dual specificity phosphatase, catalytic domain protein n=1 Tax=Kalmanozyma brasiliensis (strain GHG001) TaxID=1365824 RepID=UPI001CE731DE|nr:Dual specificity phosphatase, catalytic domain protein [Kalmanozyma brasiliensis GHG001]EST08267.2 Dual specificity phosphatase, catalytic domain protein [Kalmanozyma brasiliensis GHG001]